MSDTEQDIDMDFSIFGISPFAGIEIEWIE